MLNDRKHKKKSPALLKCEVRHTYLCLQIIRKPDSRIILKDDVPSSRPLKHLMLVSESWKNVAAVAFLLRIKRMKGDRRMRLKRRFRKLKRPLVPWSARRKWMGVGSRSFSRFYNRLRVAVVRHSGFMALWHWTEEVFGDGPTLQSLVTNTKRMKALQGKHIP